MKKTSLRIPGRGLLVVAVLASSAFPVKIVLDIPQVVQEQTEWCWAASSSALLGYYGKTLSQCQIANYARANSTWHDFGQQDCCSNGSGACNYWNYNYGYTGSIQEILKNWGVDNTGTNGSLTLAQIATQLEAKRPFIIRWAYVAGGGHFIVGHGLSDSSLHYMDSWPGEGSKIAKLSWVVSNKDKTWDGTNVPKSSPTASVIVGGGRSRNAISARVTENGVEVAYDLETASPVEIRIQSMQGKVLKLVRSPSRPSGSNLQNLSTADLPAGGYVLRLKAGDRSASAMLFVER